MPLKTIIIEDEPLSMQYISSLLSVCPQVHVVEKVTTVEQAVSSVKDHRPDLLFLDVELRMGNGFEILSKTWNKNYLVVFTTAINDFALKLIQLCAVPLLQKPLDAGELEALLIKLENKEKSEIYLKGLEHLMAALNNNYVPVHITLHTNDQPEYVLMKTIVLIETAPGGSVFYLKENEIKTSINPLPYYENLLEDFHFFRVNSTQAINLNNFLQVENSTNQITMTDGSVIQLSGRKKEKLILALAAMP